MKFFVPIIKSQTICPELTENAYSLPSTFNDSMNSLTRGKKPWYTKLSSAGLVYLHFGHRVISAITGECTWIFVINEEYPKLIVD